MSFNIRGWRGGCQVDGKVGDGLGREADGLVAVGVDEEALVAGAGEAERIDVGDAAEQDGEAGVAEFGFFVGWALAEEMVGVGGGVVPIEGGAGGGIGQVSAFAHGVAFIPGGAGDVVVEVELRDAADADLPFGGFVVEDGGDDGAGGPVGELRAAAVNVEAKPLGFRVDGAKGEDAAAGVAVVVDAEQNGGAEGVVAIAEGGGEGGPAGFVFASV